MLYLATGRLSWVIMGMGLFLGGAVIASPQFGIGSQQAVIIRVIGTLGKALVNLRRTGIIPVAEAFTRFGYHGGVAMLRRLSGTTGQDQHQA